MSNRIIKAIILSSASLLMSSLLGAGEQSKRPGNGFVPDEKTAVSVAEAVLIPIFGDKLVRSEEPFTAQLKNGIWVVRGTVREGLDGGAAEIKISKRTCEILSVIHEQ